MSVGVGVDVGASRVKVATVDVMTTRPTRTEVRHCTAPELISRVGTQVPLVGREDGAVVSRQPHDLFVHEVHQAIGRLAEQVPTDRTDATIIAPDWWTPRACLSVREALRDWGLGNARLVSSGVAAVRGYRVTRSSMPATVAVLDLGAHTCSAVVVTGCDTEDVRRVGHPTAVHGRAGDDLDARLLHHVLGGLRAQGITYRHDDREAIDAARTLLDECRSAKESLSVRPVVTMSQRMPDAASQFRLVRAEHDDLARPAMREIVQMLKDCIASAGLVVDAVLLIGGGAPIPLVTQQISVELGLPVLLDDDPSTLAARGAAMDALAAAPTARRSAHRPIRLAGWWPRPRARHTVLVDRRHRGTRAGVAAIYVAIALIVGSPISSLASPAGAQVGPGATTASSDELSPGEPVPGDRERPPSPDTDSETTADSAVRPQFTGTNLLPTSPTAPPAAATSAPSRDTKGSAKSASPRSSGSSQGAGSGSSNTPTAEPPPAEPPVDDTPPTPTPPPSDPDVQ